MPVLPPPYDQLPDLGREIRYHLENWGMWPLAVGALDLESGRSEKWEAYYQPPRESMAEETLAEHKAVFRADAALHPFAMRIRLVTVTDTLGNHAQIWSDNKDPVENEREVIARTFAAMGPMASRTMWVGVNLLRFDIPRLVQRALVHRVPIPVDLRGYRSRWAEGRAMHINDLMEFFAQGGDTRGMTLQNMCTAFGLPGKTGDFGVDFGEVWDRGVPAERRQLCFYNLIDDDQALRIGLYSMAIHDYAVKSATDYKLKNIPALAKECFILRPEIITTFSEEGNDHFKRGRQAPPSRIPDVPTGSKVVNLDSVPHFGGAS